MATTTKFKAMDSRQKSLLYLCYVVMSSDGTVQRQENKVLKQIMDLENISQEALDDFNKEINNHSLEELRKMGLEALMQSTRENQINTLAWVHNMIYADKEVNVKEAQFLMGAMKPTDITFDELKKIADRLPKL